MRILVRLGTAVALGAAMLLPAMQAQASTTQPRVKYNFVARGSMLSGKLHAAPVDMKSKTTAGKKKSLRKNTRGNLRKAKVRRGKRVTVRASRRAGYNACRNAARKFGVPVATALAVCRVESGFRCSAVGAVGELGLLQIKLATARGIGYRGSRRALLNCSTGAYWGMKHLAMAIRRGGVWKHNAGLYAKRPNRMARKYARLVAAAKRRYR